jgi:hypothetical protein
VRIGGITLLLNFGLSRLSSLHIPVDFESSSLTPLSIPLLWVAQQNLATLEGNGMGPAKQERAESEAVQQKSTVVTAQVSWCAHAWNATPEQAARQVVADLYAHLSRGGSVTVRVEELNGKEHTIEARARR